MKHTWMAYQRNNLAHLWVPACLALLAGLAACQAGATPTPEVAPSVAVDILPAPTKAPPLPACLEVEGVRLDVKISTGGETRLAASGLNPAEKLTVVFYAESEGRTFKIESSPVASPEGTVEYVENLGKVAGGFFKNWQVQVVHARGVACTQVSLP